MSRLASAACVFDRVSIEMQPMQSSPFVLNQGVNKEKKGSWSNATATTDSLLAKGHFRAMLLGVVKTKTSLVSLQNHLQSKLSSKPEVSGCSTDINTGLARQTIRAYTLATYCMCQSQKDRCVLRKKTNTYQLATGNVVFPLWRFSWFERLEFAIKTTITLSHRWAGRVVAKTCGDF